MLSIEQAKQSFFTSDKVLQQMDKKAARALSRFGAFVRRRSRQSIRKRKAVSEPGKPPSSHEGSLKRLIFFSYDSDTKSVVIGPTLLGNGGGGDQTVPAILEFGGTVRSNKGAKRYRERPYMNPAFMAEVDGGTALKFFKE